MPTFFVLHYTTPPDVGGCEIIATELAAAVSKLPGWRSELITGTANPAPPLDSAVTITSLPEIGTRHPLSQSNFHDFREGRAPRFLDTLATQIYARLNERIQSGDVVFSINAFSLPYNISLTAALSELAQRRKDVHHATWCFDLSMYMTDYDWSQRELAPWSLLWKKQPNVQYFVCSTPMREQLAVAFGEDSAAFQVLPAGVSAVRALRATEAVVSAYAARALSGCFPIVFVPAKMSRRKALDVAVDVHLELKSLWPDAHLVIAGSPSPHDEATAEYSRAIAASIRAKRIEDSVTILSWIREGDSRVSFEDTQSMIALSDAVLLTSSRETFIVPILEAALSKTPVFVPGTPEVQAWASRFATIFARNASARTIANIIYEQLARADGSRIAEIRKHYSWASIAHRAVGSIIPQDQQ